MIHVVWSANPHIQQVVDLLHQEHLALTVHPDGFRAVTRPQATAEQVLGDLIRFTVSGLRPAGQVGEDDTLANPQPGKEPE